MRCPVCDKENSTLLCPDCGFDASLDYEKYPTFGPVGDFKPASALRREKEEARKAADTEQQLLDEIAELKRQLNAEKAEKERLLKQQDQTTRQSAPTSTAPETPRKKSGWLSRLFGSAQEQPPDPNREPNILRQDRIILTKHFNVYNDLDAAAYPVFGSKLRREQIETVTFLNTVGNAPATAWDVSAVGNRSVLAWAVPNGAQYHLYIAAGGGIDSVESCRDLFAGYRNLRRITFGDNFHTRQVVDMKMMFSYCSSLKALDLSCFDTSMVEDMTWMFGDCSSLVKLNLSSFNTSKVRYMSKMFWYCSSLAKLNLRNFDTSQVRRMSGMFFQCASLSMLDLGSFNTVNVHNMQSMFCGCSSLTTLDLRNFNTANVEQMSMMFYDCSALRSLNLSSFNTSKVKSMVSMFSGCTSLTDVDISSFDISNANTGDMFAQCPAMKKWITFLYS